jgi:hypothetical protein
MVVRGRTAIRGEDDGAEVIRYCTSKLPCKMECGGKRAEYSPQGRRLLPPFHRYIDNNGLCSQPW